MLRTILLGLVLLLTFFLAGCDADSPYRGPDARLTIDDQNYVSSLQATTKPVVLEFYADWCGPCREIEPIVASASVAKPDFLFAKIDVDAAPQLSSQFQINSIPCIVFMKDGKEVGRSLGSIRKSELEQLLSRHFPSEK